MLNPFDNSAFSMAALTNAINILPNNYDRLATMGLFPDKPQRFRSVTVEEQNGVLTLLPTLPVGSPGTVGIRGKRKLRSFILDPREGESIYDPTCGTGGMLLEAIHHVQETRGDGIVFDPDSVKAAEIRKEAHYAGIRVTLMGVLDKARCPVQADIGFGDAVVPGPDEVDYPVLLAEMPAPHLRVYPRYTVVAEKLEALTSLGMLNSRMKDYFDLWVLVRYSEFDGQILIRAVAATFERRQSGIPDGVPIGLSDEFANDPLKEKQWNAFLRKNSIAPKPLSEVVTDLRDFLMPVLASANQG